MRVPLRGTYGLVATPLTLSIDLKRLPKDYKTLYIDWWTLESSATFGDRHKLVTPVSKTRASSLQPSDFEASTSSTTSCRKSTTLTILCVHTLTTTFGSLAALRQRLHLASQPPSTSTAQQARPRRHQHQKEQEFPRLGWASVSCPGRSWTHPGLWDLANTEDSGASTTHPLVG